MHFIILSAGICRETGWISGAWENWILKSLDMDTFYGLALAYEAGRTGGSLPTVFNAANEMAVGQFLNREIKYLEIIEIIEDCMRAHKNIENPTLDQILETEAETYARIKSRR